MSTGLNTENAIEWDFGKYYKFEKELENELGCLGCCESKGECGVSVEEAERLTRNRKARDKLNDSSKSGEGIGGLLSGFELGRNRKGVNFFFDD